MPQTKKPSVTPYRDAPYQDVSKSDLILRDRLAADRTVLANERTLLAYVRTALGLLAGGAGLVHFFDAGWLQVTGWFMMPLAPLMLAVGLWRFLHVRTTLKHLQ